MEFQPMSPEEMQRTMQFVLNQQAQFAADFEKQSGKTDRMTDAIIGLTGIVGHVVESVGQLGQSMAELREYIKTVGSHLDVVVEMFERHLREGHGHKPS